MAKKRSAKLKPTKSYGAFESVSKRSLNMLALQSPIEKIIVTANPTFQFDLSDMARAAVVLAVAAMDAYFTDVFAERFVPFIRTKGPTKDLVNLLEDAGLDASCALDLLTMNRPYRRIRKLIEVHLALKTTQK